MRAAGDAVVAVHVTATAAASAAPVDQTVWQAFRFRGGIFVAWFRTEDEALEAMGLSE
jgi:hypothetical protein